MLTGAVLLSLFRSFLQSVFVSIAVYLLRPGGISVGVRALGERAVGFGDRRLESELEEREGKEARELGRDKLSPTLSLSSSHPSTLPRLTSQLRANSLYTPPLLPLVTTKTTTSAHPRPSPSLPQATSPLNPPSPTATVSPPPPKPSIQTSP